MSVSLSFRTDEYAPKRLKIGGGNLGGISGGDPSQVIGNIGVK